MIEMRILFNINDYLLRFCIFLYQIKILVSKKKTILQKHKPKVHMFDISTSINFFFLTITSINFEPSKISLNFVKVSNENP